MTEKDGQVQGFGGPAAVGRTTQTTGKPEVLRARDIIPGSPAPILELQLTPTSKPKSQNWCGDIPQFDLAEDIMAEQRRLTAGRRTRPGNSSRQRAEPEPEAPTQNREGPGWDPIVADIVARDIERLCAPIFY
jgi:hypothetical protein